MSVITQHTHTHTGTRTHKQSCTHEGGETVEDRESKTSGRQPSPGQTHSPSSRSWPMGAMGLACLGRWALVCPHMEMEETDLEMRLRLWLLIQRLFDTILIRKLTLVQRCLPLKLELLPVISHAVSSTLLAWAVRSQKPLMNLDSPSPML